MIKNISRLVFMGAMLSPATSFALGLGEINLRSALNQPFDAEIELISPTADELASLKVALASTDTFERYGLDKPLFLSGFNLRVARSENGRQVIKVTSPARVTEPFVNLLIEANWPRGHLVREYTVLLDPPVYMPGDQAAAAPVAAPRAGAQSEGAVERQRPPESAAAAPRSPAAAARSTPAAAENGGGTYQVRPNDTLSRIASRLHAGSRADVNRAMMALYRGNPQAFDGNINLLRAGSVLRVPETAEVDAISAESANAEVSKQYQSWRSENSGRLRLVAPPEGSATPAPAAQSDNAATAARVRELESQLAESKRLVDLKNAELAQLQSRLREKTAPPRPTAPAPSSSPPVEAPAAVVPPPVAAPPASAPQTPASSAPETPVTPAPVEETRPAPPPVKRPITVETPPEPSFFERYSWLLVVGGLLILAGVLFSYFRKRRAPDLEPLSDHTFTPADFADHTLRRAAPADEPPDAFLVEESRHVQEPAALQSGAQQARKPSSAASVVPVAASAPTFDAIKPAKNADDTLSSDTAVQFDQQDALAEADFHMAYGLYDQAADLVKISIERDPARRDLKLKLLEIYFVWGNRDLFLETARQLHATRDEGAPGEWDKIHIMGKQIAPEDPLFQGEVAAHAAGEFVDVNLEGGENRVDIDLFEPPAAEQSMRHGVASDDPTQLAKPGADSSLDFLLDEPRRGADDEEPTREIDTAVRTQETPTIESPGLDRTVQTIREKMDKRLFSDANNIEHTAEVAIDDLGLDLDDFEETSALDDTGRHDAEHDEPLRDDELTRIAKSPRFDSSLDKTVETPAPGEAEEGTSTIFIEEQPEFGVADTAQHPRIDEDFTPRDIESTSEMKMARDVDVDLDHLADGPAAPEGDTVKRPGRGETDIDRFSADVFNLSNADSDSKDFDLLLEETQTETDTRKTKNADITSRTEVMTSELQELEPVTMSEVGTKLDLARAYMDMGDPDGARSILEEVLQEGNVSQKQEAQRLVDSIR